MAWLIPILIVLAFATKGISLYAARMLIIRVGHRIAGEIQKRISNNILVTDIQTLENRHSGKYISNIMFDAYQDFTIEAVKVFANGAAERTIALVDADENIIQEATIMIPDGEQVVQLHLML